MSPFGRGPYFCKHHPEREVVAPIALRLCAQCLEDAQERYVTNTDESHARYSRAGYQLTPWGERSDARIKGGKGNERD